MLRVLARCMRFIQLYHINYEYQSDISFKTIPEFSANLIHKDFEYARNLELLCMDLLQPMKVSGASNKRNEDTY